MKHAQGRLNGSARAPPLKQERRQGVRESSRGSRLVTPCPSIAEESLGQATQRKKVASQPNLVKSWLALSSSPSSDVKPWSLAFNTKLFLAKDIRN